MSDAAVTKRQAPERQSALIALELNRLNIDITCLSECRIPGEGEFIEGDYTFLYPGRSPEQTKLEGVAIAIKNSIRPIVIDWKGTSSWVVSMRIKLDKFTAIVIGVYAPTFKKPPEEKALFYDQLSEVLSAVPRSDRIFLLGTSTPVSALTSKPSQTLLVATVLVT